VYETLISIGVGAIVELDSTKARILEAAGNVFAQKGFESGTVRDICQLANVNLAAVNYHFGDKRRLYVETVKHAHCSRAEEVPLPDWASGTPAETKLREFIGVLLARMLNDSANAPWHAQLMLREIARPNLATEELVKEYIRPHFQMLKGILRELMPTDTSEERVMLLAFSTVGQCLFYRTAQAVVRMLAAGDHAEIPTPQLLEEHITSVILAAIGHRRPVGAEEYVR
jgi:TetR/AcrR family transcriptional regulator, regulator of cefoperazone and chloramphenicol sensitivity